MDINTVEITLDDVTGAMEAHSKLNSAKALDLAQRTVAHSRNNLYTPRDALKQVLNGAHLKGPDRYGYQQVVLAALKKRGLLN